MSCGGSFSGLKEPKSLLTCLRRSKITSFFQRASESRLISSLLLATVVNRSICNSSCSMILFWSVGCVGWSRCFRPYVKSCRSSASSMNEWFKVRTCPCVLSM